MNRKTATVVNFPNKVTRQKFRKMFPGSKFVYKHGGSEVLALFLGNPVPTPWVTAREIMFEEEKRLRPTLELTNDLSRIEELMAVYLLSNGESVIRMVANASGIPPVFLRRPTGELTK